jgi:hypothetical protein
MKTSRLLMSSYGFNRRVLMQGIATAAATVLVAPPRVRAGTQRANGARIQRLDWAGIRIEAGDSVAYIDAVTQKAPKSRRCRSLQK